MTMYLLLALFVVLGTCWAMPQVESSSHALHAFAQPFPPVVPKAVQSLTLDLAFEAWTRGNTGNMIMSPLSISSVLTLLMMGAKKSTRKELQVLLHYSGAVNENDLHEEYADILSELARTDRGIIVNLANRIYVQNGAHVLESYTKKAKSHYSARVRDLDFRRRPESARKAINSWVSNATEGKIPELLKLPLSPDTSVVAVNTLFFNASWQYPFPVRDTTLGNFRTGNKDTDVIKVPMMHAPIHAKYKYIEELQAEIIALPYAGNQFSMFILMPKGEENILNELEELEQTLTPESLQSVLNSMTVSHLNVFLPRFSLRHNTHLKNTITKLLNGRVSMFDPSSADFSEMVADENIYLSDVVHEVVMEVTEEGTVAAAATAATLTRLGTSGTFNVTKPFIVFIRDTEQDLTLFWGRVVHPEPVL